MLRKIFFWSHLVVGLIAGVVIFLLCLTGAILAFEMLIVNWAERDVRARAPSATAELLPLAEVAASAKKLENDFIANIECFSDPDMPVRVRFSKQTFALVNGHTGEVLGRGAVKLREFMRWTTALHTNLQAQVTGRWMTGISNACFVFLILSGLWIWWPRQWRWKALRSSLVMRFDVSGKARDWNWHNVLGFWLLVPLLLISATGLVLSFKSVNDGWRDFASRNLLSPAKPSTRPENASAETASTWAQVVRILNARHPGWRSIIVNGNGSPNKDGLLFLTVNLGQPRHRLDVFHVKFDTRAGAIIEERDWSNDDAPLRARAIARLGHTGEIIGTWGQALAFIACVAGLVLVYTGFALSWRRFFGAKVAA